MGDRLVVLLNDVRKDELTRMDLVEISSDGVSDTLFRQ